MNYVTRNAHFFFFSSLVKSLKLLKNSMLRKVVFTKCRFIPFIQSAALESVLFFLVHCMHHLGSSWEISTIEPVVMYDVYVVVNCISQVTLVFLLFLGIVNVCQ